MIKKLLFLVIDITVANRPEFLNFHFKMSFTLDNDYQNHDINLDQNCLSHTNCDVAIEITFDIIDVQGVPIYGPFKHYYNKAITKWMMNNPARTTTIYNIAMYVKKAYFKAMVPNNIHSGFKKTGIFPLNRDVFSDDDCLTSAVADKPDKSITNSISETSGCGLILPEENVLPKLQ